jgi:hypothetical protein
MALLYAACADLFRSAQMTMAQTKQAEKNIKRALGRAKQSVKFRLHHNNK